MTVVISSGKQVVIIWAYESKINLFSRLIGLHVNTNNSIDADDIKVNKLVKAVFRIAYSIDVMIRRKNCNIIPEKTILTQYRSTPGEKTLNEILSILLTSTNSKHILPITKRKSDTIPRK